MTPIQKTLDFLERLRDELEDAGDVLELTIFDHGEDLADAIEALEQLSEPVAVRFDFDGNGYRYLDNGSGSDWQHRHKDAELLYVAGGKS